MPSALNNYINKGKSIKYFNDILDLMFHFAKLYQPLSIRYVNSYYNSDNDSIELITYNKIYILRSKYLNRLKYDKDVLKLFKYMIKGKIIYKKYLELFLIESISFKELRLIINNPHFIEFKNKKWSLTDKYKLVKLLD